MELWRALSSSTPVVLVLVSIAAYSYYVDLPVQPAQQNLTPSAGSSLGVAPSFGMSLLQQKTVKLGSTEPLRNGGRDCWGGCRARGGFCDWCGRGNACCRRGWNDPPECRNAIWASNHGGHQCVSLRGGNNGAAFQGAGGGLPPLGNNNGGGLPPLGNNNGGGLPPLGNNNGDLPALGNNNGNARQQCQPYSVNACAQAAEKVGLRLGGVGYQFTGAYGTKGCYSYRSGKYRGHAYYGTGGGTWEMRGNPGGVKFRPPGYDRCKADDDANEADEDANDPDEDANGNDENANIDWFNNNDADDDANEADDEPIFFHAHGDQNEDDGGGAARIMKMAEQVRQLRKQAGRKEKYLKRVNKDLRKAVNKEE